MTEKLLARCGLDCAVCPAFIAKRTGDEEMQRKAAEAWSGPDFPVAPEEVVCDGCASTGDEVFKHCNICEVRSCASSRGHATCADCPDYTCEKLEKLYSFIGTEAKATLDGLRAGEAD